MKSPNRVSGLATGLVDLDRRTTGLHEGELIIIAGRPGMGKTTLAMNFAVHAALRGGHPVAVFTLEMPEHRKLVQRILASQGPGGRAEAAHRRVQPSGLEAHRRAGGPALPDPALSRRQRQLQALRRSPPSRGG